MSTTHNLTCLFFCGFALLTVSAEPCKRNLLEGGSCTINPPKKIDEKNDIIWTFTSGTEQFKAQRKNGKPIINIPKATIDPDGSLNLRNIQLTNTGKYAFEAYDNEDKKIAHHEMEITVYAKVLKPNVTSKCSNDEGAKLSCETNMKDKKDLIIIWFKGKELMKDENKANLSLTLKQLQQNQGYFCRVKNPVSEAQSEIIKVPCGSSYPDLLFGFDFWLMVGILAGGGALLLLLILVLMICAVRSCKKQEKQQDEEELRLRNFHTPPSEQRFKSTARGQPAPPIPQVDSLNPTPTAETPNRTQAQPKGQVRARPPPPPRDEDEEDPPPLPQPRKKRHHEKRTQEPYQPME